MKVNKSFETPEGIVKFEGELSQEELDYVLQLGLNTLLVMGAISAKKVETPPEDTVFQ